MRSFESIFKSLFAAVLLLLLGGCTSGNDKAPQFNATGEHPAGWVQNHWAEFIKNPGQCQTCHGSTSDPQAAGGVAKVSCFSCHKDGVSHTAGWSAGSKHGRLGAQAAPTPYAGFAYCAKCHGSNYNNGIAVSCMSCHTKSPHPDKPWRGASLQDPGHANTHAGNAAECAKCHTAGANSGLKPSSTPEPGSLPGCFNNTLCHGRSF